ncbi:hypothetical protein RJ639_024637 [Escallonia herrerae]|uniref:Uncharacterized protein n=1 Tax=Escallonia herrerae TaxID=1293975 RepID=A0AA88V380_9ASTE|nr:hypothetical protein RJ639_024637 [Escallonia herrerae]
MLSESAICVSSGQWELCCSYTLFRRKCDFKGKTSGASREQKAAIGGRTSMLLASRFDEDYTLSKVREISIGQSGELNREPFKKVECHAFQWRDVPTKVTGTCNMPCTDQLTSLLDDQGNADDQYAATSAAKCFNGDALDAESLKEQEMSNVSSGCSAPAITQASVKVSNEDSCTVDVQDGRFLNNIIVDEGSGIDKCWSSDDASDSERSEFHGFARSIDEGSSKAFSNLTSGSLIDEIRLRDSLRLKRGRNQSHPGFNIHENTKQKQNLERGFKTQKKRKAMFPASGFSADNDEFAECSASAERHSHSSRNIQMSLRPDLGKSHNCACSVGRTSKQKRCSLSFSKTIYSKSDLHTLHRSEVDGVDCEMVHDDYPEFPEASRGKRFRLDQAAPTNMCFRMQEPDCTDVKISEKCNSMNCMITSSCLPMSVCKRKATPIVGGKYGVISNGDTSKPAKVLSLMKVLKRARRCTITENEESKLTSANKSILKRVIGTSTPSGKFNQKEKRKRKSQNAPFNSGLSPTNSMEETFVESNNRHETCILEKEIDEGHGKKYGIPDTCPYTRLKLKSVEVLKRTPYALTKRGKDTTCSEFAAMKNPGCVLQKKSGGNLPKCAEESKSRGSESYNGNRNAHHGQCSDLRSPGASRFWTLMHFVAFVEVQMKMKLTVCWSVINALFGRTDQLMISRCIRLAMAFPRCPQFIGIADRAGQVPKTLQVLQKRTCYHVSQRYDLCVLCGYGGGAMTQALRSNNIVKTLLKAWDFEEECEMPIALADTLDKQLNMMTFSGSEFLGNSLPTIKPAHIKSNSVAVWKLDLQRLDSAKGSSFGANNSTVQNSITAGILDSTVKQWVHMVCGLWTPGTRCPNVDTMSAFDVSGVSCPKVNMVCSMCNRPGGACIQCRAANCSVLFHPWCAHRKGLLQSEVEGFDDECVGFYGRCDLHATHHQCSSDANPRNTKPDHPGEEELTCARTEGYKGRKREGYRHNIPPQSDGTGGCLVSQEQLNAWLHIHGQKLCTKGLPKLPALEVEYDCRKEYARYKQSKGWKHLVVYKSGIHALGLYTSRFIPRGAMVVEYVGEIVGLRVSDKRENEYQSGQKLQYKSACYFFKIDKEHIIDATRKGGIARFVNHSCMANLYVIALTSYFLLLGLTFVFFVVNFYDQPNCVAKVITVRNEKKVVFFAERDVYPGEEITYDYHFNHEDEVEKIPCSCNSKNCRRSLN